MYKKRILGLAIASALTLTGCLESNEPADQLNTGANHSPNITTPVPTVPAGAVYPIFNPALRKLPTPNDLILQRDNAATGTRADGTYSVFAPADGSNPAATALNELGGASTIAPIDIAMSGEILPASALKNATVFMFALEYASDSPLQALGLQEPPTILPADQPSFDVTVESIGGTNNTIRITPTTPLLPNKRYVVAVTKNVRSALGENIVQSPGTSGYAYLTDPTNTLANPALSGAVSLIDFWERIVATATRGAVPAENVAMSYSFTTSNNAKVLDYIADPGQWASDTIQNLVKVGAVKKTTKDLSDADQEVTHAALESAVNTVIGSWEPSSFNSALIACDAAQAGQARFDCAGNTLIAGLEGGLLGLPAGSTRPTGSYFPTPRARTSNFSASSILDINQISALTASLSIAPGKVRVSQGTLELPYFLEAANGANGAPLVTGHWKADDSLATVLNGIVGDANGTTEAQRRPFAQYDAALSTAITANFPFPKQNSVENVPVLAIYPASNAGNMRTVMFQHGITTDRSAALAFGAQLVSAAKDAGIDLAVIAIDQPLHGIEGISQSEKAELAERLLSAAAASQIANNETPIITPDGNIDGSDTDPADQLTINAVVAGQLSVGARARLPQQTNCAAVDAQDLSSSTGVLTALGAIAQGACNALGAGAATLAQGLTAVLTAQTLERSVANGGSTVAGLGQGSNSERHFGFTSGGPGRPPVAMNFNGSREDNSSGSMFINLANFLGSRDNLRQGSVDLMSVRRSIGSMDIDGDGNNDLDAANVYFVGHSLGTVNGIPFVSAVSSSRTQDDNIKAANMLTPGGGLTRLVENSPAFGPTIIAGLAGNNLLQNTANYQAYLNVLQATVDSGDAINFAGKNRTPTLYSLVIGDQTIPNAVTDADNSTSNEFDDTLSKLDISALLTAATNAGNARQIPILAAVLNLPGNSSVGPLSGTEPLARVSSATTLGATGALGNAAIVRYTEGNHGTPVFPSSGTNEEKAAFAEMIAQTVALIATDANPGQSTTVVVGAGAPIQAAPAPAPAP